MAVDWLDDWMVVKWVDGWMDVVWVDGWLADGVARIDVLQSSSHSPTSPLLHYLPPPPAGGGGGSPCLPLVLLWRLTDTHTQHTHAQAIIYR